MPRQGFPPQIVSVKMLVLALRGAALAAAQRCFVRTLSPAGDLRRRRQASLRLSLRCIVGLLLPAALSADSAIPELPVAAAFATQTFESASLRWNGEARDIVRRNRTDPLWAARTYAMVSVAQYDAAKAAESSDKKNTNGAFTATAIASSAATMLAHLYPHEVPRISAAFQAHLLTLSESTAAADRHQALALGEAAALSVLQERQTDGAISLDTAVRPMRANAWYSSEDRAPLRTYWGRVRPFLSHRIGELGAPPPGLESTQFSEALETVRIARNGASGENDRLAKKWADGPGTATPPGHWNQIADALIARHQLDELESARVLALMNMAMMDASILCWRSKFEHWLLRPSQVDPEIVPSFPLPNFPSYPSGHAAFSGAASAFLAYRFPGESGELNRLAEEAALSRVVGGVHYPFDSEAGLQQGRRVAKLAIGQYQREGTQRVAARTSAHSTHSSSEDRP